MFYRQLGWSAQDADGLIGVMTIFQVAGAFGAPLLARRWSDRRPWLLAALFSQLVGMAGLLLAPQAGTALWIALIGCGLGSMFSLCLTLTLDHLPDARAAGHLAAFVQGIGFIIMGIIPYAVGWLRELTGGFQVPWLLLVAIVIAPWSQRCALRRPATPVPWGASNASLDAPPDPSPTRVFDDFQKSLVMRIIRIYSLSIDSAAADGQTTKRNLSNRIPL